MEEEKIVAYVGIDWADRKHDIAVKGSQDNEIKNKVINHSAEGIEAWVVALRKQYPTGHIAVCLEQSRGALIYALMKYEGFILYPINGSTLAKYREAFRPNRGKDDPSDANFLLDIVLNHRDKLRVWVCDEENIRKLRYLVEFRRKVVAERTRISNKLTAYLKSYFPQVLEWFSDIKTYLVCDFIEKYSMLEQLQAATDEELLTFFEQHKSRRSKKNQERIEQIRVAVPLVTDRAVIESTALIVKALAVQMRALLESVSSFDTEIEDLYKSYKKDAEIFASFPGAGEQLAPRMLAAFGVERSRFETAQQASQFFGIAPLIESSGKQHWVRWRYFCPKFLRQTFHEFANESIKFSFWAKAAYRELRSKGKSHHVAIRALAFKWIRIIWKCWQDKVPYNEVKYLNCLKKKQSPLLTNYLNNGRLAVDS